MKLEIFQFIDESIAYIQTREEEIQEASKQLYQFFDDFLSEDEHYSRLVYRIKTPESLKEKILRKNLFLKYKTPEILFQHLHDLIGLRIECRFTEEEVLLYRNIFQKFKIERGDGYFSNEEDSRVELNLSMQQPQILQNGFSMYKIDGRYEMYGQKYNFELQIQSMVNVFWGEIEHRILYKNTSYMITEDFFREVMNSINENLRMIDKQLMQVYHYLQTMGSTGSVGTRNQMKGILSKMVHDFFVSKVLQQTGMMPSFKHPSDLLIDFLFYQAGKQDISTGEKVIDFFNRIHRITQENVELTDYITVSGREAFYNRDIEDLAQSILEIINMDYQWNLFFHALFLIKDNKETGVEFNSFIAFIYQTWLYRICRGMEEVPISKEDKEELEKRFYRILLTYWNERRDIDLLNLDSMRHIERKVALFLRVVERPEDLWALDFERFYNML